MTETVTRLKSVHEDIFGERRREQEHIEGLEAKLSGLKEEKQRQEKLQRQLGEAEQEIERQDRNRRQLANERDSLATEIGELEDEIQQLQDSHDDELLELRQEIGRREYELEEQKAEVEEIEATINQVESLEAQLPELKQDIQSINEDLEYLRDRIEKIEQDSITEFNQRMDEIRTILDYDNLERIWLERKEVEAREGRRKVTKTEFEMHVVRTAADGTAYEDTVSHLSESEREVTGLVFALAGYLVHDLQEEVPFMILDSLEAIDSHRIARLIDYFEDIVLNILVALLPEDASALPDDYTWVEYSAQQA